MSLRGGWVSRVVKNHFLLVECLFVPLQTRPIPDISLSFLIRQNSCIENFTPQTLENTHIYVDFFQIVISACWIGSYETPWPQKFSNTFPTLLTDCQRFELHQIQDFQILTHIKDFQILRQIKDIPILTQIQDLQIVTQIPIFLNINTNTRLSNINTN